MLEDNPACFAKPLSDDMHFGSGRRGMHAAEPLEHRDNAGIGVGWGLDHGRAVIAGRMAGAIDNACARASPFAAKPSPFPGTVDYQRSAHKGVSFALREGENAEPNTSLHSSGIQASPIRISRASLGGLSSSFVAAPKTPLLPKATISTPARALVSLREADSPMSVEATPAADAKPSTVPCLHTPSATPGPRFGAWQGSTPFSIDCKVGADGGVNASFMSRFDDIDCAAQLMQEASDLGECNKAWPASGPQQSASFSAHLTASLP